RNVESGRTVQASTCYPENLLPGRVPMNDLIRSVFGPGLPGHDPSSSDAELLAAYTRDGNPAAFGQLVERHGPMVYAVCRRILPDPNDADDAFQAVFLVFIRRAGS